MIALSVFLPNTFPRVCFWLCLLWEVFPHCLPCLRGGCLCVGFPRETRLPEAVSFCLSPACVWGRLSGRGRGVLRARQPPVQLLLMWGRVPQMLAFRDQMAGPWAPAFCYVESVFFGAPILFCLTPESLEVPTLSLDSIWFLLFFKNIYLCVCVCVFIYRGQELWIPWCWRDSRGWLCVTWFGCWESNFL